MLGLEGPVEGGRPDLAIEVIWSHGRLNKLEVYRRLGIREVWIYKAGLLTPHGHVDDAYRELTRSRLLPDLELAQLLSFLDVRPTSAAIRAYREALRGS